MATKIIAGHKWTESLCESLGLDPSEVRRIIIDVPHDGVVKVYVERFGTERLLSLEPPSAEFAKIIVDGEVYDDEGWPEEPDDQLIAEQDEP